ncbi:MAG: MmcQ/YjbR family DNA-binding protein [Phycisphaerales bacterium]
MAKRKKPAARRSAKPAGPPTNTTPLAQFCRTLPGTTEDIKWEDDLVFSVAGKMYAAFDIENSDDVGFKCDDVEFERLTRIDGIIPAPYAARFGWVKVRRRGVLPLPELKRLIRRSYDLVVEKLPAKARAALAR